MKISIISDIHVKREGDSADLLLQSFLKNPDVRSSDIIFLLGDIFDLMIGPHSQYFSRFQNYFNELKNLLANGKKICYVEGNHDFHLKNLYRTFFKINKELNPDLFEMAPFFILRDANKILHLAHGDDMELDNFGYKVFKAIVRSWPLEYYANHLMPHFLIKNIGEYSAEKSRKRNNKRYDLTNSDLTPIKNHFQYSAEVFFKKVQSEIIICGHSHVKDHYISPNGFEYANNGHAQFTKTYISIENGIISFKPINNIPDLL